MFVDFESLDDSSTIWIYQSRIQFREGDKKEMIEYLDNFITSWIKDGIQLKASYKIMNNGIIALGIDEEFDEIPINKLNNSPHLLEQIILFKKFEKMFKLDLFWNLIVSSKDGKNRKHMSLFDNAELAKLLSKVNS